MLKFGRGTGLRGRLPGRYRRGCTRQRPSGNARLALYGGARRGLSALTGFGSVGVEWQAYTGGDFRNLCADPAQRTIKLALSRVPIPPEVWASTRDLEEGLSSPIPIERARAYEMVIERKADHALDTALQGLRDPDETVRYRVLFKCLQMGVPLRADLLADLVQFHSYAEVRLLAFRTIAADPNFDIQKLRATVDVALRDSDESVHTLAQQTLTFWETTRKSTTTEYGEMPGTNLDGQNSSLEQGMPMAK
jgi:hypothetical protein